MTDPEYVPTRKRSTPPTSGRDEGGTDGREVQPGDLLLGRFSVFGVRPGGFGIVYLVIDLESGRKFAVKTPKTFMAMDDARREAFGSEVEIWINLEPHPHIVQAYSVMVQDGRPYLIMEYVPGGNLRSLTACGPVEPVQALSLGRQLCLGMEFAARDGELAHLDLKPENLLLGEAGELKISDFGTARHVRPVGGRYPLVGEGSWRYAAPERFLDEPEDSRSDVFSFGVILHELLTARLPYPFDLSRGSSDDDWSQLAAFHRAGGMKEVTRSLYYEGLPGHENRGLGMMLGACLQRYSEERLGNFAMVRDYLERLHEFPEVAGVVPSGASDRLFERATALSAVGKHSRAIELFNVLLKDRPDEPILWLEAGKALRNAGMTAHARHFFDKAKALDRSLTGPIDTLVASGPPIEGADDE